MTSPPGLKPRKAQTFKFGLKAIYRPFLPQISLRPLLPPNGVRELQWHRATVLCLRSPASIWVWTVGLTLSLAQRIPRPRPSKQCWPLHSAHQRQRPRQVDRLVRGRGAGSGGRAASLRTSLSDCKAHARHHWTRLLALSVTMGMFLKPRAATERLTQDYRDGAGPLLQLW